MISKFEIANLLLAKTYSMYSPDRTKIGAVITYFPLRTIGGFNRLPAGLNPDFIYSEHKNDFVIHAEESALQNCPKLEDGDGASIYVWGLAPCARCAGLMADKGIRYCTAVVAVESKNKAIWEKKAEIAKEIYANAGIQYKELTLEEFNKYAS